MCVSHPTPSSLYPRLEDVPAKAADMILHLCTIRIILLTLSMPKIMIVPILIIVIMLIIVVLVIVVTIVKGSAVLQPHRGPRHGGPTVQCLEIRCCFVDRSLQLSELFATVASYW